jgi:hypothetical protein
VRRVAPSKPKKGGGVERRASIGGGERGSKVF